MLEAVIGVRPARPRHTRRRTPMRPRQPPPSVPPISFDYHYYYYCVANVLQPCTARNNFCLKENKNYKNMLHIPHMNDDYCSQCEEKNKTKLKQLHSAFFLTRKKIENETEKKTLLQLNYLRNVP
mgnify:CR=1 FL=1